MTSHSQKAIIAAGAITGVGVISAAGWALATKAFIALEHLPPSTFSATTLLDYYRAYSDVKEVQLILDGCFVFAAAVPLITTAALLTVCFAKSKQELFGSARFANKNEIRKVGLFSAKDSKYPAILIGKYKDEYLYFAGQEFMFLAAPTRSGKGVGIVIPNLVFYSDSVVVLDVKLENWKKTSGFRSQCGQECYLFAPDNDIFNEQSFSDSEEYHELPLATHRWNLLSYIRRNPYLRVGDLQTISQILYPATSKNPFFDLTAQSLFEGIVLYLLDTPEEPCTMERVLRLGEPEEGLDKWIKHIINERREAGRPLSEDTVGALSNFANSPDNTRGNIQASFAAPLKIFRDKLVAAATSGDDFDFRDVRKKRMSIYVGIRPGNLAKFSLILNIFFSQLIGENVKEEPGDNPELRYQCLLLLDEFTAMGYIGIIEKAVSYMASFNLRLLLIFQNKSQLENDKIYNKSGTRTLLTNMGCQVMYAPRDNQDATEYSELLGYKTEKSTSKTRSKVGKTSRTESEGEQRRALLLPQEIREIGFEKEIISIANCKPILAEKAFWYKDEIMKPRVGLPTPYVPTPDYKIRDEILSSDNYQSSLEQKMSLSKHELHNSVLM